MSSSSIIGPKALNDMASSVAMKNIKSIETIGFLTYNSVRHVLAKVESAAQLRQIEINSPHILSDTGELWLKLIEKDFPLEYKSKAYKPRSDDEWYKVWEKYKRDHDRSLQASEEQLRSALAGLRQEKESKVSKIVDACLPSPSGGRKKRQTGPRDSTTSTFSFGGGSRTKTLSGAGVMKKARREAKEVRNIQGSLSRSVAAPVRVLEKKHLGTAAGKQGQQQEQQPPPPKTPVVKRASSVKPPPAMLCERRIAAQPDFKIPERELSEEEEGQMKRERTALVAEHTDLAAFLPDSDSEEEDESLSPLPREPTVSPRSPPESVAAGKQVARSPEPKPEPKPQPKPQPKPKPKPKQTMLQRKFAPSSKKVAATAAVEAGPSSGGASSKKRTGSQAGLEEPSGKRGNVANPASPSAGSPGSVNSASSGPSLEEESAPKKVLIRKKKPINIFMKRPAKR